MDDIAIQPRASITRGAEAFQCHRIKHDARNRAALLDHGDGDSEMRLALDERDCAVDRVDDEHIDLIQPRGIVARFLGEPAIVGACFQQRVV